MLSNILKIGVGIICIYFMRLDNDIVVEANQPTAMVFNQNNMVGKFQELFEDLKSNKIISQKSELLSVKVIKDEIIINVNESFIYIGGTYKEQEVVNEFIKLGLNQPNIKYVTILVDNKISETSEGINLYKLDKPFILENY